MPLSKEVIADASFGAALYDVLLSSPDTSTLRAIQKRGLEQYIPAWCDIKSGSLKPKLFDKEVLQVLANSYTSPPEFQRLMASEETDGEQLPAELIRALNYSLVKNIIAVSPTGKVNDVVYRVASGKTTRQFGMGAVEQAFQVTGVDDQARYARLIAAQQLRYHERFVRELPIIEEVLRSQEVGDISQSDIRVWCARGRDGESIFKDLV